MKKKWFPHIFLLPNLPVTKSKSRRFILESKGCTDFKLIFLEKLVVLDFCYKLRHYSFNKSPCMEQSKLVLLALFLVSAFVLVPSNAAAIVANGTKTEIFNRKSTTELSQKSDRKMERLEKRLAKMQRKMSNSSGIDFKDGVKKWLWFGIFGVGIGFVLGVIGIGGLGYVVGTIGLVCLIIWVLKEAEVIN
jgi:hypothetical protein